MKRQNEWMAQPGQHLDLAVESLGTKHRALLGTQNFERYGSLMSHVAREIDCGHSSLAKLTLESIPAGEGVSQLRGDASAVGYLQIFTCG